jgi:hypothetical protein
MIACCIKLAEMERVIFMFPKVVLLVMSSRGSLESNVVSLAIPYLFALAY